MVLPLYHRTARVVRHYARALVGRADPHKDHPVVWAADHAWYRTRKELTRYVPPLAPTPPGRLEKPIFVICTMRSGSSICARLLDEHPQINYVGFELSIQWIRVAGIHMAGTHVREHHDCPPLEAADATPEQVASIHEEFSRLHARRKDKPGSCFMNKNTHLWNKLPFLKAIFPDAKLVMTSRDIRSTVASLKLLWVNSRQMHGKESYIPPDPDSCVHSYKPHAPAGLEAGRIFPGGRASVLADYWLRVHERVDRDAHLFDHVALLRHPDVVTQPRAALNRAYESLDLSPVEKAIEVELHQDRNDRWRTILTPEERDDLEAYIEQNRTRIETLRLADTTL